MHTLIEELDNPTRRGEHIVHIDGVTGSSPVATTTNPRSKGLGFFSPIPRFFCGYGVQEILLGQPERRFGKLGVYYNFGI